MHVSKSKNQIIFLFPQDCDINEHEEY